MYPSGDRYLAGSNAGALKYPQKGRLSNKIGLCTAEATFARISVLIS
jgi:hypothetical protein